MQAEQKLGAVAEFQHAVFGEGVKVDLLCLRRCVCGKHRLRAAEGAAHALDDHAQTRAAAVDDARLAQHVEQIGRALEREPELAVKVGKIAVKIAFVADPAVGVGDRILEHREDGSLHRDRHRAVRFADAAFKGSGKPLDIGFLYTFKALGESREDAREDHARVAARAQQHAARRLAGDLREAFAALAYRGSARIDGQ